MTQNVPTVTNHSTPKIYYGYIIVGLAFVVMMASQGPFNAFGIFFNPIREDFNWTHTVTSAAFSISIIVRGIFSPLMGSLTDRFGPRRIMAVCAIVIGLGFFLMSRMNALWQFYLFYGLVLGFGMSGIWVPVLSSIARWFVARRSLMTSIVVSGVGIAGMFVPPLLNSSIEARGWSETYLIMAVVAAIVLVVMSRFFRPPEVKTVPRENITAATATAVNRMTLGEALRIRQLWLLVVVFFVSGFLTFSLLVHLVPHAENLGVSSANASALLSTMNGVSLLGTLVLAGIFGDRFGSRAIVRVCFVLVIISLLLLAFTGELWTLYLAAMPYGIAIGALGTSESPLVAQLFGMGSHGLIFGIGSFGFTTGAAVGPFLTGYLFDITGTYRLAFIIYAVIAVIGLILVSMLRPMKQR